MDAEQALRAGYIIGLLVGLNARQPPGPPLLRRPPMSIPHEALAELYAAANLAPDEKSQATDIIGTLMHFLDGAGAAALDAYGMSFLKPIIRGLLRALGVPGIPE